MIVRLGRLSQAIIELTDQTSVERALVEDIVHLLLEGRFYANKYIRTENQDDLDEFLVTFAQVESIFEQAEQQVSSSVKPVLLDQIRPKLTEYEDIFAEIVLLINQRREIQSAKLDIQALVLENELSALRIHVNSLDIAEISLAYENARYASQNMRLSVLEYSKDGDERYVVLFDKFYQETNKALLVLFNLLEEPAHLKNSIDAITSLNEYSQGFHDIRDISIQIRTLFDTNINELEPEIIALAESVEIIIEDEFIEAEQSIQAMTAQTRMLQVAATIVSAFVALLLSLIIAGGITHLLQDVMKTSKQIANVDILSLTTQLSRLTHGDIRLGLEITAEPLHINTEDEVGEMARAFNEIIFRLKDAEIAFEEMAAYLNEMAQAARSVAKGDLDVIVSERSEADVLARAIQDMLENLRASQEKIQSQIQRLATLRDIDHLIVTSLDLEEILQFLLERTITLLQLDAAGIHLLTSGNELEFLVQVGKWPEPVDKKLKLADECHLWEVVKNSAPVLLDDLSNADSTQIQQLPPYARSSKAYYAIPLISKGEIKGVFEILHSTPLQLPEDHQTYLEMLVGQAVIAIENIQLIKGLEDRVTVRTAELEAQKEFLRLSEQSEREQRLFAELLRDTVQAMNLTLELEELFDVILENIGRIVPYDFASVMLVENGVARIVRFRDHKGLINEQQILATELKVDDLNNLSWVVEHNQPEIIADTKSYSGWVEFPGIDWIRSITTAPINTHTRLIGFLNVASVVPDFFNQTHADRLYAFATQAATAIENAQLYEEIQLMAVTDELTGLSNRRALFDLGEREMSRAQRFNRPLSLLMFDIDKFKLVNDTNGHHVGDLMLQALADASQEILRNTDVVGRYGGEEFAIIMSETPLEDALNAAERLRQIFSKTAVQNDEGEDVYVTASFGVAEADAETQTLRDLFKRADKALYQAKDKGRNRVEYWQT